MHRSPTPSRTPPTKTPPSQKAGKTPTKVPSSQNLKVVNVAATKCNSSKKSPTKSGKKKTSGHKKKRTRKHVQLKETNRVVRSYFMESKTTDGAAQIVVKTVKVPDVKSRPELRALQAMAKHSEPPPPAPAAKKGTPKKIEVIDEAEESMDNASGPRRLSAINVKTVVKDKVALRRAIGNVEEFADMARKKSTTLHEIEENLKSKSESTLISSRDRTAVKKFIETLNGLTNQFSEQELLPKLADWLETLKDVPEEESEEGSTTEDTDVEADWGEELMQLSKTDEMEPLPVKKLTAPSVGKFYERKKAVDKVCPSILDFLKVATSLDPVDCAPSTTLKNTTPANVESYFEKVVDFQLEDASHAAKHLGITEDAFMTHVVNKKLAKLAWLIRLLPDTLLQALKLISEEGAPRPGEKSAKSESAVSKSDYELINNAPANDYEQCGPVKPVNTPVTLDTVMNTIKTSYGVESEGKFHNLARTLDSLPAVYLFPSFALPAEIPNFVVEAPPHLYEQIGSAGGSEQPPPYAEPSLPSYRTCNWQGTKVLCTKVDKVGELMDTFNKQASDVAKYTEFINKHFNCQKVRKVFPGVLKPADAQTSAQQARTGSGQQMTENEGHYNRELCKMVVTLRTKVPKVIIRRACQLTRTSKVREKNLSMYEKKFGLKSARVLIETVAEAMRFIPSGTGKQTEEAFAHWPEIQQINERLEDLLKKID